MGFNTKVERKNTACYKWDSPDSAGTIPFSIADSDYETLPEIKEALTARIAHGVFGYTFPDEEYFQSVCDWIGRHYRYQVTPEDIVPTSGIVSSLFYAVRALDAWSESIIIQPPVYQHFPELGHFNHKQVIENKLINNNGRFTLDFADLEAKFRAGHKILVVCSPHNPVGRVYSRAEIARIVALAKKYGVFILADEIHCDLMLNGNKFTSFGEFFAEYENIAVFFSPSKSFNLAGLKTSNVIIKNKAVNARYRQVLAEHCYHHGPLTGLLALKVAYTKGDAWLAAQNAHLSRNFSLLAQFFAGYPALTLTPAEGTYLAWIDMRALGKPEDVLYRELLAAGIRVNKGSIYSADYAGFIRINFACPAAQLQAGLARLAEYLTACGMKAAPPGV